MTIQTFKLGRSEEYLEGLSEGYSSGFEAGLRASLHVLKRHQYDGTTIKDMVNILEEFLNRAEEANRSKRNGDETDDHNRNDS